jgi:hypothetical protein
MSHFKRVARFKNDIRRIMREEIFSDEYREADGFSIVNAKVLESIDNHLHYLGEVSDMLNWFNCGNYPLEEVNSMMAARLITVSLFHHYINLVGNDTR